MTQSREEIFKAIRQNSVSLQKYGVQRLGVFGSFARNDAGPASDVDILVELENKTFRSYMGLKFFLEELLGRKVDLVLKESIKPRLREAILGETVYAVAWTCHPELPRASVASRGGVEGSSKDGRFLDCSLSSTTLRWE